MCSLTATLTEDAICYVWFNCKGFRVFLANVLSLCSTTSVLCLRHPSNLMLDRLSGKILHIDFGDCFEVCITKAFLNCMCVLLIYLAFNMNDFTIMNLLSGILFRFVGCDD